VLENRHEVVIKPLASCVHFGLGGDEEHLARCLGGFDLGAPVRGHQDLAYHLGSTGCALINQDRAVEHRISES